MICTIHYNKLNNFSDTGTGLYPLCIPNLGINAPLIENSIYSCIIVYNDQFASKLFYIYLTVYHKVLHDITCCFLQVYFIIALHTNS